MAKGYALKKGFLFSADWEQAFRGLPANEFHALFWELYDFQKSKGAKKVPQHPQNSTLDMILSLIIPQIQNRINGAKGGDIANGNTNVVDGIVGGMVGGSLHKLSEDKISQVDMSGDKVSGAEMRQEHSSTAPPLSEADRNQLLSEGVPNKYIEEARVKRAEEYARKHRKRTVEVLRAWWEQERKKTQARGEGDLGNSYNTDDFFAAAVKRSQHENYEEVKT